MCFGYLPALLHRLGFLGAQVELAHPLAELVLQLRGLGLRFVHRREVLVDDFLRQLLVLHDVENVPLHRLTGI